jgi:FtsP/CotA-like multicopper oxidase with cupredoxin domain
MRPVEIRHSLSPAQVAAAMWIIGIGMGFCLRPVTAAELDQPPICSAATASRAELKDVCTVKSLTGGHNDIHVNLKAESFRIDVGGYKVTTGNYNHSYVAPVIEAMQGDTVSATLVNALPNPQSGAAHGGMTHGDDNPTNLHYFHGGIVSPNNARPYRAELGDGDNIYVLLKTGQSFDYKVPIPGNDLPNALDARVLERQGLMPHPFGLNWYHSHQHGISSNQVMGGMSGLLSVGEASANVKAACRQDPNDPSKCLNDVAQDTNDLKRRTMVRYAMLRDLPLSVTKPPTEANGDDAVFDPASRDFPAGTRPCGVLKADNSGVDPNADARLRMGFCQRDKDSAVLFTVNGQRFPTITVKGGQNLLLRVGDLSANVPYWLELTDEKGGKGPKLTVLSLDGVVPAAPTAPGETNKPVLALEDDNILLMPAARAEIYIRNDQEAHSAPITYLLRTKHHLVGADEWPEIQLAEIVLEPHAEANKTLLALNAPVARVSNVFAAQAVKREAQLPKGCVRDLNLESREYRRVTFFDGDPKPDGTRTWAIATEIVVPGKVNESDNVPDAGATLAFPFEQYLQKDGHVDWENEQTRHVCIKLDHKGSHKQLWVLFNGTDTLHNFHIHQMKFRLATLNELQTNYSLNPPKMDPPLPSHDCARDQAGACTGPDYDFYDDQTLGDVDPGATRRWHDTIPIPPGARVFLIMSFDARQQIGRFVFHCHILKHEDFGLMAPIEVWDPQAAILQ